MKKEAINDRLEKGNYMLKATIIMTILLALTACLSATEEHGAESAEQEGTAAPGQSQPTTQQTNRTVLPNLFASPLDRNSASSGDYAPETPEDLLEMGLSLAQASPTHLALRASVVADSTRCQWRGVARTTEQREEAIRFWLNLDDDDELPSASAAETQLVSAIEEAGPIYEETLKANVRSLARGGLTDEYQFLTCYTDYSPTEYLVGSAQETSQPVTVAYDRLAEERSYALYQASHTAGEFGDQDLSSEAEYASYLKEYAEGTAQILDLILGENETLLFLAPMSAHNTIATEAWQAIAQWDLQEDDSGTTQAVRYGADENDAEHTQTIEVLKNRVTTAAAADAFATTRIANVSGLTQHYRTIGAYDDITPGDGSDATFMPAMPPPIPTCAGSTAVGTDPDQGLVDDCNVLLDAKDTLAGTATLNWSKDLAMSSWDGITLSGGRVHRIILTDKDLNGVIPAELGDLTGLTRIDLDENDLTGEIPAQLGNLKQMTHLYLFDNALTGVIPPELGHMTSLQILYVEDNLLTGAIPTQLGDLSNLTQLILGHNALSGPIPDEIAGISTLRHLSVRDNNHTGQIPRGLSARTFAHLSLSGNGFTGCLPTGMETVIPDAHDLWRAELAALPSCGPTFSQATYAFPVARTSAAGDTVGTAAATPWDTGGTVAHTITAGNEDGLFQTDQATGAITLARAPAGTDSATHTLTVQGADGHGQETTATVTITLTP